VGRRLGCFSLTKDDVERIVRLRDEEKLSFQYIAERFGVTSSTITVVYKNYKERGKD
jgi:transcriptional regulator with XRE-family HTH domain